MKHLFYLFCVVLLSNCKSKPKKEGEGARYKLGETTYTYPAGTKLDTVQCLVMTVTDVAKQVQKVSPARAWVVRLVTEHENPRRFTEYAALFFLDEFKDKIIENLWEPIGRDYQYMIYEW